MLEVSVPAKMLRESGVGDDPVAPELRIILDMYAAVGIPTIFYNEEAVALSDEAFCGSGFGHGVYGYGELILNRSGESISPELDRVPTDLGDAEVIVWDTLEIDGKESIKIAGPDENGFALQFALEDAAPFMIDAGSEELLGEGMRARLPVGVQLPPEDWKDLVFTLLVLSGGFTIEMLNACPLEVREPFLELLARIEEFARK